MNNENIRQTQKGVSASVNPRKPNKELATSSILSNNSKTSQEESASLFKSCKLSATKVAELRNRAQMLDINEEDSSFSFSEDQKDKKGQPGMPHLQYDNFSLNDSLTESLYMSNMKDVKTSNISLKDSIPDYIANYNHMHMVKPPSYIQNSGVINKLQDSRMIDELLNSNIKLKSTQQSSAFELLYQTKAFKKA